MPPTPMNREDWLDTPAGEIHDSPYLGASKFVVNAAPQRPKPEDTPTNRALSDKRMFAAWYITRKISGLTMADMLSTTKAHIRQVPEQGSSRFYDPEQDHDLAVFLQDAEMCSRYLTVVNDWRLAVLPLTDPRTAQAAWPELEDIKKWELNTLLEKTRLSLAEGGTPFTVSREFVKNFDTPTMVIGDVLGGIIQYLAHQSTWGETLRPLLAEMGVSESIRSASIMGDTRAVVAAQKAHANLVGLLDTKAERSRSQISEGFRDVLGVIAAARKPEDKPKEKIE